ncbi:unnamed protein product [Acanthoscelides obtectus]|nr:unnamed protein product [Acanthoscelides obtectus]CAK1673393.1 Serine protease inhibitor 28Dc [Acanthoscelides obtectus]
MGLAAGVDIQGKSLVVHEHLNKILQKLTESSGIDLDHQLFLTSAIFVQKDFPIRNLYKQTAETIYKSSVLNVDFKHDSNKAVEVMNAWVTEKTKGKIKSILAMPPSESTRVVIASALYFKALWEHPFFAEMTFRRPFYTNGRKSPATMEVEMMSNGGKFPYYKDPTLKCEIMGLPYKGNATTMYIIVPSDSSAERLKEFQRTLTQQDVDRLADSTEPRCVVMGFPKMKIESTIELRDVLSSLGVQSLFQAGEANLAMLSPGEMMADAPITLRNPENNPIVNCSNIFNPNSTEKLCETTDGTKKILFKKFGDKVGRRVVKRDDLDSLRELVNEQSSGNFQNPGLYASNVIHKVYMDITETGTEAAASTAIALARSTEVTFRVDVPFLFFIRHEFTKTILFWGSVTEPTPSFPRT